MLPEVIGKKNWHSCLNLLIFGMKLEICFCGCRDKRTYMALFLIYLLTLGWGLPILCSGKESTCQCKRCKRCGSNPWVRKIPWIRKWQPATVFLPGNSMDREAWQATVHGVAELDMTQTTHTFTLDFFNFIDRQFLTSVNTADFKFTIP